MFCFVFHTKGGQKRSLILTLLRRQRNIQLFDAYCLLCSVRNVSASAALIKPRICLSLKDDIRFRSEVSDGRGPISTLESPVFFCAVARVLPDPQIFFKTPFSIQVTMSDNLATSDREHTDPVNFEVSRRWSRFSKSARNIHSKYRRRIYFPLYAYVLCVPSLALLAFL